MRDFVIVSEQLAQEIKSRPTRGGSVNVSPLNQALLDGKVVHLPGMGQQRIGGSTNAVRQRGYRVISRSDGNGGSYVWAEKKA